jgi:hypothetical protein
VNAFDGILVTLRCYKHNRHIAHLSEPPRDLNTLATSFETDIDEGDIGLIVHSK